MKFIVSTTAQAHNFDVAKELHRRGDLVKLLTAYPVDKLRQRGFADVPIASSPTPFLITKLLLRLIKRPHFDTRLEPFYKRPFDRWASRQLSPADVLIATSSTGLLTGRRAKEMGIHWICDRPCSHIQTQDALLVEEYQRFGLTWPGIHPHVIDTELQEYEEADQVLIASTFARNSMLAHGVPAEKLITVPYGIDLSRFYPTSEPDQRTFQVIFAGQKTLRKGVRYLIDAFQKLKHPGKKLLLVGSDSPDLPVLLDKADLSHVEFMPSVPQERLRDLFSQSHVLVLPSIEDGFGLVMSQAMSCGCPVIATENTGAIDLFESGTAGYVVPIRDVDAMAARLQELADDPAKQRVMATSARERAQSIGGWEGYVDKLLQHLPSALQVGHES